MGGTEARNLGAEDPGSDGRYERFAGGHNTMVDSLHLLASGDTDEFCVCLISRP